MKLHRLWMVNSVTVATTEFAASLAASAPGPNSIAIQSGGLRPPARRCVQCCRIASMWMVGAAFIGAWGVYSAPADDAPETSPPATTVPDGQPSDPLATPPVATEPVAANRPPDASSSSSRTADGSRLISPAGKNAVAVEPTPEAVAALLQRGDSAAIMVGSRNILLTKFAGTDDAKLAADLLAICQQHPGIEFWNADDELIIRLPREDFDGPLTTEESAIATEVSNAFQAAGATTPASQDSAGESDRPVFYFTDIDPSVEEAEVIRSLKETLQSKGLVVQLERGKIVSLTGARARIEAGLNVELQGFFKHIEQLQAGGVRQFALRVHGVNRPTLFSVKLPREQLEEGTHTLSSAEGIQPGDPITAESPRFLVEYNDGDLWPEVLVAGRKNEFATPFPLESEIKEVPPSSGSLTLEVPPQAREQAPINAVTKALDDQHQVAYSDGSDRVGKPVDFYAEIHAQPTLDHREIVSLIERLQKLGIERFAFAPPDVKQANRVIVACPANVSWRRVRELTEALESQKTFQFDVRIAESDAPVTPVGRPAIPSVAISSGPGNDQEPYRVHIPLGKVVDVVAAVQELLKKDQQPTRDLGMNHITNELLVTGDEARLQGVLDRAEKYLDEKFPGVPFYWPSAKEIVLTQQQGEAAHAEAATQPAAAAPAEAAAAVSPLRVIDQPGLAQPGRPPLKRSQRLSTLLQRLEETGVVRCKPVPGPDDFEPTPRPLVLELELVEFWDDQPAQGLSDEQVVGLLERLQRLAIAKFEVHIATGVPISPLDSRSKAVIVNSEHHEHQPVMKLWQALKAEGGLQVRCRYGDIIQDGPRFIGSGDDPVFPGGNSLAASPDAAAKPDSPQPGASPYTPFGGRGPRDAAANPPRSPTPSNEATPPAPDERAITVFLLKYTRAADVARIIEQLFADPARPLMLTVDDRTNALLLRDAGERAKEIEELIRVLDTEAPAKNVPNPTVPAAVPTDPFPGSPAGPNSSSGFPGSGRSGQLETTPTPNGMSVAPGISLTPQATSLPVDDLRREFAQHDRQTRALAARLQARQLQTPHADPAAAQRLKDELRVAVMRAFEARQMLQRAEVAELAGRLQRLQQTIELRQRIADRIIARRVEELLNPSLEWDQPPSSPNTIFDDPLSSTGNPTPADPTPTYNGPISSTRKPEPDPTSPTPNPGTFGQSLLGPGDPFDSQPRDEFRPTPASGAAVPTPPGTSPGALVFVPTLVAPQLNPPAASLDASRTQAWLNKLQGRWSLTQSHVDNGETISKTSEALIEGSRLSMSAPDGSNPISMDLLFRLAGPPQQVDLKAVLSPAEIDQLATDLLHSPYKTVVDGVPLFEGLIEVTADGFRICSDEDATHGRPIKFIAGPASVLWEFRRLDGDHPNATSTTGPAAASNLRPPASVHIAAAAKSPDDLRTRLVTLRDGVAEKQKLIDLHTRNRARPEAPAGTEDRLREAQSEQAELRKRLQLVVAEYQSTISLLESEVALAKSKLDAVAEQTKFKERMAQKGYRNAAEVKAIELQEQAARLEVQRVESQLQLYRQAGEGLIETSPPVEQAGVILSRDHALLEISLNVDDGVRVGEQMFIVNDSEPIGIVEITSVQPNRAAARVLKESRESPVRKGDGVGRRVAAEVDIVSIDNDGVIEVAQGADEGVEGGTRFAVFRGEEYLGLIDTFRLEAGRAFCRPTNPEAKLQLQPGDRARRWLDAARTQQALWAVYGFRGEYELLTAKNQTARMGQSEIIILGVQTQRLRVHEVRPDSPAAAAGIAVGDLLLGLEEPWPNVASPPENRVTRHWTPHEWGEWLFWRKDAPRTGDNIKLWIDVQGAEKLSTLEINVPSRWFYLNEPAPAATAADASLPTSPRDELPSHATTGPATSPSDGFIGGPAAVDEGRAAQTAAERAVGRLVLVFFGGKSRRTVPALLIAHGDTTLVVTAAPATVAPQGIPPAIDRAYLQRAESPDVPVQFDEQLSSSEVAVYRGPPGLGGIGLEEFTACQLGDRLGIVSATNSPENAVLDDLTRLTAADRAANLTLPVQLLDHQFEHLQEVEASLAEGTVLVHQGKIAGLALLGQRFLGTQHTFILPGSRLREFAAAWMASPVDPTLKPALVPPNTWPELEGTWQITAMTSTDREIPEQFKERILTLPSMTIRGNQMTRQSSAGREMSTYTVEYDPTTVPRRLTFCLVRDGKTRRQEHIVEFDGDTMRLGTSLNGGGAVPESFEAPRVNVQTYRRVAAAAAETDQGATTPDALPPLEQSADNPRSTDCGSAQVAPADSSRSPDSIAERAVARLVVVFFGDRSRRAVPAVLVDGGTETLVVVAGTATIVPDGTPPAKDRIFLELPGREPIDLAYDPALSGRDLFVYRAPADLDGISGEELVEVEMGDRLDAVAVGNSPDLAVTRHAVQVSHVEGTAKLNLPERGVECTFGDLRVIDRSLPEGTVLLKDGKLAGLVLIGDRFGSGGRSSYVLPAKRLKSLVTEFNTAGDAPPQRTSPDSFEGRPASIPPGDPLKTQPTGDET